MTIKAQFDGSCGPTNPGGKMGFGVIIHDNYEEVYKWSGSSPEHEGNSNNVAEYIALENTLDFLIENGYAGEKVEIRGDSMLVVMQMNKRWKIKQGRYKETALRCLEKLSHFDNLKIIWVGRNDNSIADELSKGIG